MNKAQIKIVMREGVTEEQAEVCAKLAERFNDLQIRYHGAASHPVALMALMVARWHTKHEAIAFSVLSAFDDANFAHDLGAIARSDDMCSLRSARCYHKGAS